MEVNLNETIGPTSGAGPELESRKDSYYASSHQQDRKKKPRQARYVPAVAVSVIEKSVGSVDDKCFRVEG